MKRFTFTGVELDNVLEVIKLGEARANRRGGDYATAFRQALPFFEWLREQIKSHRFGDSLSIADRPLTINVPDSEAVLMDSIAERARDEKQMEHMRFHDSGLYCHACQEV